MLCLKYGWYFCNGKKYLIKEITDTLVGSMALVKYGKTQDYYNIIIKDDKETIVIENEVITIDNKFYAKREKSREKFKPITKNYPIKVMQIVKLGFTIKDIAKILGIGNSYFCRKKFNFNDELVFDWIINNPEKARNLKNVKL
jgi:hypothetical protein